MLRFSKIGMCEWACSVPACSVASYKDFLGGNAPFSGGFVPNPKCLGGTSLGYQACLSGYKVAYFNMQKLFEHITMARIDASLPKFFDKMAQTDLLILEDFGMKVLDGQQQQLLDIMEIIEDRHARKSTIIIIQLPVADWYDVISTNTTAVDAILDRIVHTAQRFELDGDSLRKN